MKYLIMILFLGLCVESAVAEDACRDGNITQPMQRRIDSEFTETYQNIYRFAQIYCRKNLNCFRAESVTTDDVGGDISTGKVVTEVTQVVCTARRKFGIKASIPLLDARELRTAFNDLSESGNLPQLRHAEGRDLTVPRSEDMGSQGQSTPADAEAIE